MTLIHPAPTRDDTRGQSEAIGIVLLTGVVVLTAAVVGAGVLANLSSQAQDTPLVDVEANATTEYVTIEHIGGDGLDTASVSVVVLGESRARYDLSSFTQDVGGDSTRFERGDRWRRPNTVGGDRLTILVVDETSNTVVDEEQVTVDVTIFARFSWSPDQPTQGQSISFDASNSEVEGSSLTSYEWDFDDDGTVDATGETASTSYADDGDYPVTLTVTAADGRTATTTKTVTVYNAFPDAQFTYTPSNPGPNEQIEFDASGSIDPDGTISSYAWDFDDDGNNEATGETATFTYGSVGDYTARLTVTDDDGTTKRESKVVSVGASSPPSVTITGSSISGPGNYDIGVTFEATDSDGDITSYTVIVYESSSKTNELARGSSTNYDGTSTTESFQNVGTERSYYVVVRVEDSQPSVSTAETEVDANNGDPTASFDYLPSNPGSGDTISFDASGSTDPDGDSLTYEWDWTGDGNYEETGQTPTHSYESDGSYDVTLRVSDGEGGVDTTTETVVVGSGEGGYYASITGVTDSSADCDRNNGNNKCKGKSSPTSQFTIDWSAGESSGNLQTVTVELIAPDETTVDSESYDYSPSGTSSASGTSTLTHSPGEWNGDYTIRVTATDSDPATSDATDTRTETADGS